MSTTPPVTHAPANMDDIRGRRCQCSGCGVIATQGPGFDFYVIGKEPDEGKPLLCTSCWYQAIARIGPADLIGGES